jgi:hypothetical protein
MTTVIMDISKTLKTQVAGENFGFDCCEEDGQGKISSRFFNHHCMTIEIPTRDRKFHGASCMNYIRTMVTHDNCNFGEAQFVSITNN